MLDGIKHLNSSPFVFMNVVIVLCYSVSHRDQTIDSFCVILRTLNVLYVQVIWAKWLWLLPITLIVYLYFLIESTLLRLFDPLLLRRTQIIRLKGSEVVYVNFKGTNLLRFEANLWKLCLYKILINVFVLLPTLLMNLGPLIETTKLIVHFKKSLHKVGVIQVVKMLAVWIQLLC